MSALPSELRSNFCHTKGLDDTRMTPESFPLRFLERRKTKLERHAGKKRSGGQMPNV